MTKRKISSQEIEFLIDFIKPQGLKDGENISTWTNYKIPKLSAITIADKNKNNLRKQLQNQFIYPSMLDKLKNMIIKQYNKTLISPGESVGVIGAQSIGEKQTQTTLNSFHTAGAGEKMVTTGVPRVEELMMATKEPKIKSCKVYIKNGVKSISELRKIINHSVVEITFQKIAKSYKIIRNKKPESWYEAYSLIYGNKFQNFQDCISIKIDMDILYEYNLTLKKISELLSFDDCICVFSPDNIGQLDVFVQTENISLPENRLLFIDKNIAVNIYLEEVVQFNLYKYHICGIKNIKNIYFNDSNKYFETEGSNFPLLLGLPFVDSTQTISNNIWDIYWSFGVEAAREFLIEEFMSIMKGINICHIELLVEKMTFAGTISSMSRYTMRTDDCGPLCRSSFEETMDNFLRAGIYGQDEDTKGVSASIICGKRANIGTGIFDIKLDKDKLIKNNCAPPKKYSKFKQNIDNDKDKFIKNTEENIQNIYLNDEDFI